MWIFGMGGVVKVEMGKESGFSGRGGILIINFSLISYERRGEVGDEIKGGVFFKGRELTYLWTLFEKDDFIFMIRKGHFM